MTRTVPPPPPYTQPRDLLRGKTAVITAAAGTGIGYALAKRSLEEGASLVISDAHERRLLAAAARLAAETGGSVDAIVCDVTAQESVDRLFAFAVDRLGHIDVLFNNAGLGGTHDLVDMPDDAWHKVLDVTLTGTMRCTRAALQHMLPRRAGTIVNNASVLGWRAQAGQSHYAAAKAGVMALTRCAAVEAAPAGVRINAVAPSFAKHPFLVKVTSQELLDELESQEAFGRAAEVWEVANVMIFLAGDLSSYMTGEVVSVSSRHP